MVKRQLSKIGLMLPKGRAIPKITLGRQSADFRRMEKIGAVQLKNKTITIAHMYPIQMNVYGDMGNVTTLRYRLETRGYNVRYAAVQTASELEALKPDIIVGGGGQDSNQAIVHADVVKHRKLLLALHDSGIVGLMVCGMYQLLGNSLSLSNGIRQDGARLFDIETVAGDERLIGNVVVESKYGDLVGFENHLGLTTLASKAVPLGTVTKGAGNNGYDSTEGVESGNMFGTYMHGPVLAKNPVFADELILRALIRRHSITELEPIDDFLELQAAKKAAQRPR